MIKTKYIIIGFVILILALFVWDFTRLRPIHSCEDNIRIEYLSNLNTTIDNAEKAFLVFATHKYVTQDVIREFTATHSLPESLNKNQTEINYEGKTIKLWVLNNKALDANGNLYSYRVMSCF